MDKDFETKEYVIPDENEIIEITEEEYEEDFTSFEQDVKPNEEDPLELMEERNQEKELEKQKKEKRSLKEKWNNLSKKKKALIIIVSILFITLIVVGLIFFLKDEETEEKKKEEPSIVIEKDNYRYENGSLVLLDKDDQEIGRYECKNKDEEKCRVAYQNNEDTFDEEMYVYEDGTELKLVTPIINNTYAFIFDNKDSEEGMVHFYDLTKNEVVENYSSVKYYKVNDTEYLIIENDESQFGLFEVTETELKQLIDFKYDYLGIKKNEFQELNKLVAIKDGKYLIVDSNGKEVSKKIGYPVKSFNDKYIVVENDGIYNIVDYRNNKVFNNEYNYIILQENYVIAIKEANKVVVLDYNETSLQNNEIKIPNEYYNKTYIYDENNQHIETKESFWILTNDNSVTIEYYKNETDVESNIVNIYEGLVSQNYEYISYFDGKLYIYDDEAKTNLLGSYKCINKNTINSIDSVYENCYLAKESSFSDNELTSPSNTLGYLPVINKRYIFINDTLDKNSNNIVLYDLQENKTLGSYYSIDAGIYDGKATLSFVNGSDLDVIGKSTRKNKFGVISITKDNVSSILPMDYESLERIGDYFLVESAETYQLYNENGEALTEKIGSKIINYVDGYVKTKKVSGDIEKYSVYSFDSKQSVNDLDYVELQKNFFVTIDSEKKLSVYNYSDFENACIASYPLETEEYKYSYVRITNDYDIVVTDESGLQQTISPALY